MTLAHRPAILVGRTEELGKVRDAYISGSADLIVLAGAAGIGKSHLADAVARSLSASHQTPVQRMVCTAPLQEVPFASIAGIVSPRSAATDDTATLSLAAGARAALATDPVTVLVIDDINLLDEPSAALVAQLIGNDGLFVVATMRNGLRVPEALRSTAQTERTVWLDLAALDRGAVRELAERTVGGEIDGACEVAVWTASQGNPLYVRELVAGSTESGSLHRRRDIWTLDRPLATGRRLHDLVEDRLGALHDHDRELVQLLALCQPVALALLPPDLVAAAERLDHSGHLAVDVTPAGTVVRLAHPIYAEAMAESMSRLGRQRVLREHLARLTASGDSPVDEMAMAVLELDAGVAADSDLLVRAAARARHAPDFRLVKRLAGAAIAQGVGGADAPLLLADALYELGEHEASRDAHQAALDHTDDEFVIMLFATSAHRVLLWGLDAPDDCVAMLSDALARVRNPMLRDAIRSCEMNVLAFSDRAVEALAIDAEIAEDSFLVEEIAAVARSVASTCVGRSDNAVQISRDAEASQVLSHDPRAVLHPVVHQICRSFAYCEAGDFDRAVEEASTAFDRFVSIQMPLNETWSAINVARAHLFAGRLVSARRWANEAAAAADRGNFRTGARLALMVSAICAAQLGQPVESHLRQLAELPDSVGFFGIETPVAIGWCLQSLGRVGESRDVLLAGADAARRRGLIASEVFLVHECARAGVAPAVADRARELVAEVETPFARARLHHVLALAAADADLLGSAAEELEHIGALLAAAEAAAASALRHRGAGDTRRATTMTAMAERLAARCDGARTPGLISFQSVQPLTDREREIAVLASQGHSSRTIAEQLFVSPRTVENHLQRVYTKLGITGRAGLAAAVDVPAQRRRS